MTNATTTSHCSLCVLDVPEFDAIVRVLRAGGGVTVKRHGDYHIAEAANEITLRRSDTGVGPAVWFGALTGGISGRIVEFSEDTLRLAPLTAAE